MSSKKVYEKRERHPRGLPPAPRWAQGECRIRSARGAKRVGGLIKGLKNAQKIRQVAAADSHKGASVAPIEGQGHGVADGRPLT